MAQIVHDVAPGASLSFHYHGSTKAGMATAITDLAADGADIVVDDITFFSEAMFQDDVIAQAVDQVVADGVAYFSSAGNQSTESYESEFRDSGTDYHDTSYEMHDFDPDPGNVDVFQSVFGLGGTRARLIAVPNKSRPFDPISVPGVTMPLD